MKHVSKVLWNKGISCVYRTLGVNGRSKVLLEEEEREQEEQEEQEEEGEEEQQQHQIKQW